MRTIIPQNTRTESHRLIELKGKLRDAEYQRDRAERKRDEAEDELDECQSEVAKLEKQIERFTNGGPPDEWKVKVDRLLSLHSLAGPEIDFLERVRDREYDEKEDAHRLREIEGLHRFELLEMERSVA
jgi:hypothetical protein